MVMCSCMNVTQLCSGEVDHLTNPQIPHKARSSLLEHHKSAEKAGEREYRIARRTTRHALGQNHHRNRRHWHTRNT